MLNKNYSFSTPSLHVAANRLPFSAFLDSSKWKFVESPGGLVSALKSVDLKMNWIGWLGSEVPSEQQDIIQSELSHMSDHFALHPVFLTKEDKENFYNGFSNQMIWPNFHDLSEIMHYSEDHWKSYQEVNHKFAHEIYSSLKVHIEQNPQEQNLVWIHDYQLMLAPAILRELLEKSAEPALNNTKIGFFLHIPFPSVSTFQSFPEQIRCSLIEGLLATDLVGVHEQSYLDNFIEGVITYTAKPIRIDRDIIEQDHHVTQLGVYPIGIEPDRFEQCLKNENAGTRAKNILQKYKNSKVILGVDRMDPSKGLVEKLLGYEAFLEQNPGFRGKTVLLQIAVPSRTDIQDYKNLKENLCSIAKRINEKYTLAYGPAPVEIIYDNFGVDDLSVFYRYSDALLVTSLKDGMNLVSFEYSVCQVQKEQAGALLLSKNAGAARYLHGSILVDPLDVNDIAQKILQALVMPQKERESRWIANWSYVKKNTAKSWADDFIKDLKNLKHKSHYFPASLYI